MAFRIKIPDTMPVLSHGNHDGPNVGACFMEYTALLAGEPFSDRPKCVDHELSSIMMWINDSLPDVDRHLLVPFLGRGIGLVYPRCPRKPNQKQMERLDYGARMAAYAQYNRRLTGWDHKVSMFRADEVLPRLMEQLPELIPAGQAATGALSSTVTLWFNAWAKATGSKMMPTEDGRHDHSHCYKHPDECLHHLDAGHRAGVEMMLRIADAAHVAYEDAMEARGWRVKREPACDLPEVMQEVRQV